MESISPRPRKLGLIVNPIAGMGGAVALKGTDGAMERARGLGARPQAAIHAASALRILGVWARDALAERERARREHSAAIELWVAGASMGEEAARGAGFEVRVASTPAEAGTSAADTRRAAEAMLDAGVDLLLFAGGDGTARDIFEAIGQRVPILGIPAGVKMHSAVFATSAAHAGEVACRFLDGARSVAVEAAEVMDREVAEGERASPRLFGFARSPRVPLLTQYAKSNAGVEDAGLLRSACRYAADLARDDALTILGPGTTLQIVRQHLGFEGTLDGVDLVSRGQPLALDLSESQMLNALASGSAARIIVSIVGGQGYLFGRGNQQISAAVIRRVGCNNIVIVAAKSKLLALPEQCLFVDTAAPDVDALLSGYRYVRTSSRERMLYRVRGGNACAPAS